MRVFEKGLVVGIKKILEGKGEWFWEPVFWYAKILRQDLLATLWASQRSASGDVIEYGRGDASALETERKAATFFEVKKVVRVQCFPFTGRGYFGAWIDAESQTAADLRDTVGIPEPVNGVCSVEVVDKFLIPQMLYSNLLNPADPVTLDFTNYMIGLA